MASAAAERGVQSDQARSKFMYGHAHAIHLSLCCTVECLLYCKAKFGCFMSCCLFVIHRHAHVSPTEDAAAQALLLHEQQLKDAAERDRINALRKGGGASSLPPPGKRKAGSSSTSVDPLDGLHPWATEAGGKKRARQNTIKEKQKNKVNLGQSFEGRSWKSEAEMVMRQGYD